MNNETTTKVTAQDAISHIESLYPPDSHYPRTAEIGQHLLESININADPEKWRDLPESDLMLLAEANLIEAGEDLKHHGF